MLCMGDDAVICMGGDAVICMGGDARICTGSLISQLRVQGALPASACSHQRTAALAIVLPAGASPVGPRAP